MKTSASKTFPRKTSTSGRFPPGKLLRAENSSCYTGCIWVNRLVPRTTRLRILQIIKIGIDTLLSRFCRLLANSSCFVAEALLRFCSLLANSSCFVVVALLRFCSVLANSSCFVVVALLRFCSLLANSSCFLVVALVRCFRLFAWCCVRCSVRATRFSNFENNVSTRFMSCAICSIFLSRISSSSSSVWKWSLIAAIFLHIPMSRDEAHSSSRTSR